MSKVNQVTQTTSLTQQLGYETEGKTIYVFIKRHMRWMHGTVGKVLITYVFDPQHSDKPVHCGTYL